MRHLRAARGLRRSVLATCCAIATLAAGCSRAADAERGAAEPAAAQAQPAAGPPTAPPRIVFLGDSLTAGLGVAPAQAYPALIEQRLRAEGYPHEVVNAGVSGDTSAGGLRRLDWSLAGRRRGAGRRARRQRRPARSGADPSSSRTSARSSSVRAGAASSVLLAGMEAPPNFGDHYTREFRGGVSATSRKRTTCPSFRSSSTASPASRAEPGRRHSSQPRRAPHHRRPGLAAARAACWRRGTTQ